MQLDACLSQLTMASVMAEQKGPIIEGWSALFDDGRCPILYPLVPTSG
jgi:hypothetical protein